MFHSFQRPAGSRIHRHNRPSCRSIDFHPSLSCGFATDGVIRLQSGASALCVTVAWFHWKRSRTVSLSAIAAEREAAK